VRHAAGDVGQDNREVYQGWLGLSKEQVERLVAKKVI
jgi:crotonobetainyl-CoA:carnitine CoA-transferase CaiB-like acyl-CoA transferase